MKKRTSFIFSAIALIVLTGFFGYTYFDDHAWGTWGDDSAGYIFLAGRMNAHEPLVYTDELAKEGLDFFGDEKLARWLTPTHHQFINTQGTIASKYPVGASILLNAGAVLTGSSKGFYIVTPFLAVLNLLLVYVLVMLLLPQHRFRHAIGFLSAFFLGMYSLYYDYAIAQPMREIPSIAFLMLMGVFVVLGVKWVTEKRKWPWTIGACIIAGFSFGVAFLIRETSAMVLPAVCIYAAASLWKKHEKKFAPIGETIKKLYPYVIAFTVAMIIALIPLAQNSIAISSQKEVFKARDTSSVVILSNFGHIETLGVSNIFGNEGKFRPGKGSLPHYWGIMQKSTPLPYFLVFVFLGMFYMWRESKPKATLLTLWGLGTLTIFSLWINPYSRYILPLFPPLLILGSYGVFEFYHTLLPSLLPNKKIRITAGVLIALTFFFAFMPGLQQVQTNLAEDVYRFKAIAETAFFSIMVFLLR